MKVGIRLLMADGQVVAFEHELTGSQFLAAAEFTSNGEPVVRVPFYMHGRALHTLCVLDSDETRRVEW